MNNDRFSNAEDWIIMDGFGQHLSDQKISDRLAEQGYFRGKSSVHSRRHTLGLIGSEPNPVAIPKPPTPDQKFKMAMLAAIHAGEERAVLGVVKDRRPFALNTIHAEPTRSCVGSAAALCAEG